MLIGDCQKGEWEGERERYSCVIVCAAPHAPEKAVKRKVLVMKASLRPKISENLDQIIRKPVCLPISNLPV
jgi:hypothetical protein